MIVDDKRFEKLRTAVDEADRIFSKRQLSNPYLKELLRTARLLVMDPLNAKRPQVT